MYTFIHKFRDYLRYREAVKKADEAHAKDGDRYYVVPSNNMDGKILLLIMDRKNFRKLKQKGYINKDANIRDLVNESFYFTPYVNGDGYLDAEGRKLKLKLYFSYCKAQRELKNGKK